MKHFITPVVSFLVTHLICCGALLTLLITSGYLLTIHHIGVEKKFLIPSLLIALVAIYIYFQYKKCCNETGENNFFNRISVLGLYLLVSFIISLTFIVYFFIPWWIPNYQGGFLLP